MKKLLVYNKNTIIFAVITSAILAPLLCSFSFFDMVELKKFNCKTQSIKPNPEGLNPKKMDIPYYNYIKEQKRIEVFWNNRSIKSKIGTYNAYEKDGKLYWGAKDREIWGGKQFHNLLAISTMKLKRKIYDEKGVFMQELDLLCKRGW